MLIDIDNFKYFNDTFGYRAYQERNKHHIDLNPLIFGTYQEMTELERGNRMRNMTALIMMTVLLLFTACGNGDNIIDMTTGGTGGTYYPVGGAIAQILSDNIDDMTVNSLIGNASVANCELIGEGGTDLALVQNNVAYWAYEGVGAFEDNKIDNLRGIGSLYPEAIQIVALKESGITSVEDLKGKRVSVGVLGSGVHFDVENILKVHKMTEKDFEALYLSFSEAAAKLKGNQIDAAFVTAGYPTSSVLDVNLEREIVIVPIEPDKIEAMMETLPFYSSAVIPADTYSGVSDDVLTVTTLAMLVVGHEIDDDVVYEITKTLWEHRDELEGAHENGRDITVDSALQGMGIPLHPGAAKYYKEIGVE